VDIEKSVERLIENDRPEISIENQEAKIDDYNEYMPKLRESP
jgi:hypothetical protein